PAPEEGLLAFWLGALCIKLLGWLVGDVLAARVSTIGLFVLGTVSLWKTAFHLGRRSEAQPLRLAFGGQPEPDDYGRTLADTAVLIYLGCLGLLLQSHETLAVTLQGALLSWFLYRSVRYIEDPNTGNVIRAGAALGALTLTRGYAPPLALLAALFLCTRSLKMPAAPTLRHLAQGAGTGVLVTLVWLLPAALLILFDPVPENGDLLKLLPPMALMAAFGLPTMKRGAINAIDWFSVMVLTLLGALVWLFWIAKLTGWPAQLAKNALKQVPGFKPEFGLVAFLVAAATTVGWIVLVHWRLSRQPSVLWRAVVLSSGGLILLWVLLMTLFLPDLNYS